MSRYRRAVASTAGPENRSGRGDAAAGPAVRAAALAAVVVAALAATVLLVPAPAGAQDDPPPSPAPVSEDPAAEDPAAGDPAGQSVTTTAPALVTPQGSTTGDAALTESERATRVLKFVMGGLVGLAVLVAVATAVFWRRTRPRQLMAQEDTGRPGSVARAAADHAAATPRVVDRPQVFTPTPPPASAPTAGPAPAGVGAASVPVGAPSGSAAELRDKAMPPGGLWASQGWSAPGPEHHAEPDPVLPPGFVGRDEPRTRGAHEHEPGAGSPGTERWRPAAAEE